MEKFIVWADGNKDDTRIIDAANTPDAIEIACKLFDVEADAVNVTQSETEAKFYGARP